MDHIALQQSIATRLVGAWRTDPEDSQALREYGDVSLDFARNGALIYTVYDQGQRLIMLLMYRIEGDELVTTQPSEPGEHRTRFEITDAGNLILYEQQPLTYVRTRSVADGDEDNRN